MLIGYSDADWARDFDDRCSTSGYVLLMANAAVSWFSKKQGTVTLSTTEAEYVALSSALQEIIWLRKLMLDTGVNMDDPTLLIDICLIRPFNFAESDILKRMQSLRMQ